MMYRLDRNSAGAEMMKIINAAYDQLKGYGSEIPSTGQGIGTTSCLEAANETLNAIIGLDGQEIEICVVWFRGKTTAHCRALKDAGFYFASMNKR